MKKNIFLFLLCLIPITQAYSQLENYASQNFNNESALLSGAVVGGGAGATAVFYNPSLIAQDEESNLAINASLFSLKNFSSANAFGRGNDVSYLDFDVQPRFISYTYSSKDEKIDFELAIFTRYKDKLIIHNSNSRTIDILERVEGEEDYTMTYHYYRNISDLWIGGGGSRSLNDNFSIGASLFASIKSNRFDRYETAVASPKTDTIIVGGNEEPFYFAENSYFEYVNLWHWSFVLKIGAHYSSSDERLGIGLNVTLPSLDVYGDGKATVEVSRSRVFNNQSGSFVKDIYWHDAQRLIRSNIKDPFSVSVGGLYKIGERKNTISVSVEYFAPIEKYRVLSPEPSSQVSTIENLSGLSDYEPLAYYHMARSVTNTAIGFRWYINEKWHGISGFRTDLSNQLHLDYAAEDALPNMGFTKFNKYHFTSGTNLRIKQLDLILGIQYSWGTDSNIPTIRNVIDPLEYIPETNQALQGYTENIMDFRYDAFVLFFGFTYLFF